ncbi:hypothetical protein LGM85_12900 [Burkholderia multivorans]|uniref:hypothetical protein n=1 Tax=Burkholderia dolosa TaxID=152500 RepID=UPI001B93C67D|nr:hypothetical protein [Burkholderia dolosa]MBR8299894.1 hypothetical protein [Burkholderia dolosa]MCA8484831.1 hypothetical protein [Burkholderia multivorans]MDN7447347.1 hypothetical protein [Burkholderia multivorans]MDN7870301.1 hypothetical protein [Burkholderia multivorans]
MRIYAALLTCLIISGCAASSSPKLVQSTDPYTKEQGYAFGPLQTSLCRNASYDDNFVDISFLGVGKQNAMSLFFYSHEWAFLDPKLPLDMLIDGEHVQLVAIDGTSRKVSRGTGMIEETLYYPVRKPLVEKLAAAKIVQFRAMGSRKSVEKCMTTDNLSKIREVVPLVP